MVLVDQGGRDRDPGGGDAPGVQDSRSRGCTPDLQGRGWTHYTPCTKPAASTRGIGEPGAAPGPRERTAKAAAWTGEVTLQIVTARAPGRMPNRTRKTAALRRADRRRSWGRRPRSAPGAVAPGAHTGKAWMRPVAAGRTLRRHRPISRRSYNHRLPGHR